MKNKLRKIAKNVYEIAPLGDMKVPARIFVSEKLLEKVDSSCLQQLTNAARLPGIVGAALAMSDVHVGYGLPIGGVIAFDLKKGVISPEAVGYDINCGVRLLRSSLSLKDFLVHKESFLKELFKTIPAGTGHENYLTISKKDLDHILKEGLKWALGKKYANSKDVEFSEDRGVMLGADPNTLSEEAKQRGISQIGTLGAGNHFIEVQFVEKVFDRKAARILGLKEKTVCLMIHSGSRGLGHQVAADYIKIMRDDQEDTDRMLASAPLDSALGKKYLKAMAAAANFAFVNRQVMTYAARGVFDKIYGKNELELVYDITHNIAKTERLVIDGSLKEVCVHRKGATRSFGPGKKDLPVKYRAMGSPILLPGSMGTASFVLVGTHEAEKISLASAPHGAGRVLSRTAALEKYSSEDVRDYLKKKGVFLEARSEKGVPEEAPQAYKDVDEVARVTNELGIAKLVAKLRPVAVIKG